MAITYQRTMKIKYGYKIADLDYKKLCGELSKKEMYVCGNYDDYTDNNYGFTDITKTKTVYAIHSTQQANIMNVNYKFDAKAIINGLGHLIDGLEYEEVNTETIKKEWATPEGSYIVFMGDKDGENINVDCWGDNALEYDNGAVMQIRLQNNYDGLRVIFTINWEVETIQRKDKIEEAMVQKVMADMGKIQSIIEGRMNLKKFNIDTEDVEIDCHFDAKTESRSECTPDIIKQVREARRGNQ
tara:strand:- start:453 stop:1178 length:726 start_codon:yes stop_codon:yes gene_type:complete